MNKSQCRSCNADIFWVKTEKGKSMPLDCQTYIDGNIFLKDGVAIYAKDDDEAASTEAKYKSHFATCPQSKQWRKKDI
jgi:hypothetical protein